MGVQTAATTPDLVVATGLGKPNDRAVVQLRIALLGGFRVERAGVTLPTSAWKRRTARKLTKLLATHPGHALHRDQILEILWRDVGLNSALNSLGKALHAARRAFEPHLLPRESSAYLHLEDDMVRLDTEHVLIDADHFQQLAGSALQLESVSAYETALAAYAGELLPEDRYEEWSEERRTFLAGLYLQLLTGLAEAFEKRGAYSQAVDRLRTVLRLEPTREDVHRHLMRLYSEMGTRHEAVRQYQICRDVLRRELNLVPGQETETLYADVLADRIPNQIPPLVKVIDSNPLPTPEHGLATPLVDRDRVSQQLRQQLRAEERTESIILVTGEAGLGRTRLLAEFVAEAERQGIAVQSGGSGAHANQLPQGTFAVAPEGAAASRPDPVRTELAQRYPTLVHVVPSPGIGGQPPPVTDPAGDEHLHLLPATLRMLTNLAQERPVLVVFGNLLDIHAALSELDGPVPDARGPPSLPGGRGSGRIEDEPKEAARAGTTIPARNEGRGNASALGRRGALRLRRCAAPRHWGQPGAASAVGKGEPAQPRRSGRHRARAGRAG